MASQASEISDNQQKKVISPEHIIEALTTLGFQEYVEDVQAVHLEYREQASVSGLYGVHMAAHTSAYMLVLRDDGIASHSFSLETEQ